MLFRSDWTHDLAAMARAIDARTRLVFVANPNNPTGTWNRRAELEALVDALLRVSRLVGELPEIREMDLNPLVACAPGQGVLAVDARIRIG